MQCQSKMSELYGNSNIYIMQNSEKRIMQSYEYAVSLNIFMTYSPEQRYIQMRHLSWCLGGDQVAGYLSEEEEKVFTF